MHLRLRLPSSASAPCVGDFIRRSRGRPILNLLIGWKCFFNVIRSSLIGCWKQLWRAHASWQFPVLPMCSHAYRQGWIQGWMLDYVRRRWNLAARDSTNQNALFVEWFWLLKRWVFRVVCLWIFAFFQSCGLIFETIPRRKVVRRHCVDTCDVTFENLAFLCNCEEFEVAGHVQAAMMLWALFSPFFWDSMLVAVTG